MNVYLVCLPNILQKPPQKVAFLPKYRLWQRLLSTPPYRRYEKLPAPNKVVRLFHHGAASLYDTSGWLGGERTRKGDSESSKEYPTIWFQVITWWSTYFKPRDMGWSPTPPSIIRICPWTFRWFTSSATLCVGNGQPESSLAPPPHSGSDDGWPMIKVFHGLRATFVRL